MNTCSRCLCLYHILERYMNLDFFPVDLAVHHFQPKQALQVAFLSSFLPFQHRLFITTSTHHFRYHSKCTPKLSSPFLLWQRQLLLCLSRVIRKVAVTFGVPVLQPRLLRTFSLLRVSSDHPSATVCIYD